MEGEQLQRELDQHLADQQEQLSNPQQAPAPEPDFDGETFTVAGDVFRNLCSMGFSENAIKKSIACGCINEDTCTQWLTMHVGHPDLDAPDPTTRLIVKEKRILTEAEREAKIQELKDKIRLAKDKETTESAEKARIAEKKRIEMGKHMLEAKEQREAQQRANAYEERRKEKEADAKAKEKVLLDLAIAKLIRQGKSPEDAARIAKEEMEEKKKRQRDEAAEKMKQLQEEHKASTSSAGAQKEWNLAAVLGGPSVAVAGSSPQPSVSLSVSEVFEGTADPLILDPVEASFVQLVEAIRREATSPEAAGATLSTLRTILFNVLQSPLDIKKRTLKVSSSVFTTKVATSRSALRLLKLCNFTLTVDGEGQQFVVLHSVILRILHRAMKAMP